jgi:MATE family multidrug resistance protein
MRYRLQILREEIGPLVRMSVPLVLAEIGWVAMGVVDTIMVGRLENGTEAIGAVSLGNVLFYVVAIFGGGLLLGLDTVVSQAYGAGRMDACHRSLVTAIYFVLALAPLLVGVVWVVFPMLSGVGIAPQVVALTREYLSALLWSAPPLLLYFVFRRYLQGMNYVRPIGFAVLAANVVNAAGNWILIYGKLGAPAMGVAGSGWSTVIARVCMAACLVVMIVYYEHAHKIGLRAVSFRPDFGQLRRLVALGLPASLQLTLEVGVFASATTLAGRLGVVALAAHQAALHTASLAFMVPLGLSSAAAVRVGNAIGRGDARGASRAGWTAIALGGAFMTFSALCFLLFPRAIVGLFSQDAEVLATGVLLLTLAAFFQLFDGVQGVATGALRGAGDTLSPMATHLVTDWLIGLPLGAWLCFGRGWGAAGLWVGLSAAMILAGIVLLAAWKRRVAQPLKRARNSALGKVVPRAAPAQEEQ